MTPSSGSDDLRVSLYRPHPVAIRDRHLRSPPRRRQSCLRCIHLGGCGKIFRLGVVQFLLSDQAGLGFRCLLHTSVVRVQSSIFSLRPGHIVLSADDFILSLTHCGNRPLHLRLQLGNFKDGDRLPFPDLVPYIHVNVLDESRDFGMNIDHLVGLKLAG
jgi:hypothetical protein